MESEKKDNSGSALLLTLTILTFLSILGSMTLTGGLLCRKLIRRYAMTEESVYVLEQSMEEVRAGMEVLVEEEQKKSYGEILGLLYRDSVKENDEVNTLLREMVYEGTRERLLAYLSSLAVEGGSARFTVPFSRQEMADYLCVERSAMCTELSKLQREGVLRFKGKAFELLQAPESQEG